MKAATQGLLFLIACAAWAAPEARTWTSADGRTLEGRFLGATHEVVTVTRSDGESVVIPLARLSEQDRAYAIEQREERTRIEQLEKERVRLTGKFVGRVKEGILVRSEAPRATVGPRPDRLARIGGTVGESAGSSLVAPAQTSPEGTFLILDHPEAATLQDYADVSLVVYPAGILPGYTYEDTGVVPEPIQAYSIGVPKAPAN